MKRLLIAAAALLGTAAPVYAVQPASCRTSSDGTKTCYDATTRSYSVTRRDGGYVYGTCGGTLVYGGSIEWIGASQFHHVFCDGEQVFPIN